MVSQSSLIYLLQLASALLHTQTSSVRYLHFRIIATTPAQYKMTVVKREMSMAPTPTPESDGSTASALVKSTSPTSSASDNIDSKPVITNPSKKRGRPPKMAEASGSPSKKAKKAKAGVESGGDAAGYGAQVIPSF